MIVVYAPTFGLLPHSGADKKLRNVLAALAGRGQDYVCYCSMAGPRQRKLPGQGSLALRFLAWLGLSLRYFGATKVCDSALPLVGAGRSIWIIHDPKFLDGIRPKQRVLRWLLPLLWRAMWPRIVTVSQASRRKLEASGAPNVSVVPNSIGDIFLEMPHGTAKDVDIIYVANGMPHKRHRSLLRLLRRIARRRPLSVVFVGSGLDVEALHSIVAGTPVRLSIRSNLDTAELIAQMDRARCCVFASKYEGFGIPIVEAAARGLPVICRDMAVFREVDPGNCIFGVSEANILGALEGGDRPAWPPRYSRQDEIALLGQVLLDEPPASAIHAA